MNVTNDALRLAAAQATITGLEALVAVLEKELDAERSELFEIMAKNTILELRLDRAEELQAEAYDEGFKAGVARGGK